MLQLPRALALPAGSAPARGAEAARLAGWKPREARGDDARARAVARGGMRRRAVVGVLAAQVMLRPRVGAKRDKNGRRPFSCPATALSRRGSARKSMIRRGPVVADRPQAKAVRAGAPRPREAESPREGREETSLSGGLTRPVRLPQTPGVRRAKPQTRAARQDRDGAVQQARFQVEGVLRARANPGQPGQPGQPSFPYVSSHHQPG